MKILFRIVYLFADFVSLIHGMCSAFGEPENGQAVQELVHILEPIFRNVAWSFVLFKFIVLKKILLLYLWNIIYLFVLIMNLSFWQDFDNLTYFPSVFTLLVIPLWNRSLVARPQFFHISCERFCIFYRLIMFLYWILYLNVDFQIRSGWNVQVRAHFFFFFTLYIHYFIVLIGARRSWTCNQSIAEVSPSVNYLKSNNFMHNLYFLKN